MPDELKLTAIGDAVGEGDTLFAVEDRGCIRLSTTDAGFETQMAVARRAMKKCRAVLRELAK